MAPSQYTGVSSSGALIYCSRVQVACRIPVRSQSRFRNVAESGDGHDLAPAQEHAGTVAADADQDGVVDVHLASGGPVAEVV